MADVNTFPDAIAHIQIKIPSHLIIKCNVIIITITCL